MPGGYSVVGSLLIAIVAAWTTPSFADGYFLQADISNNTKSVVGVWSQGTLSYSTNFTDYESGRTASLALLYRLPVENLPIVKIGPTLGVQKNDNEDSTYTAGARLSVEKYTPTSFGSNYVLVDVSSVENSWFVLGQLTFDQPSLGFELSRGASDTYNETTLAVQKQFGDGPLSIRFGYKASSKEVFAGFSINTF